MTNLSFIQNMASKIGNKEASTKRHGNLLFKDGVLYSYGEHYPLLFKVGDTLFINTSGYSSTTAKHISDARYSTCSHAVELSRITSDYILDKDSIKDCLESEQRELQDKLAALGKNSKGEVRAWRQEKNLKSRLDELELALKSIA